MAEGAGLLNQYTGNCIEGSNPFPSATYPWYSLLKTYYRHYTRQNRDLALRCGT